MSALSRPMPWWPEDGTVLDFVEFLDTENSWGWPDVDVRARYRHALGDPSRHDPTAVLARLYVEISADRDGTADLFGRNVRDKDGCIMWSEAYYAVSKVVYPDQDCPECWDRPSSAPGHSVVNGYRHHAPSWPIDGPDRCSLAERRDCWHGEPKEVWFDSHGCLTSCCGAAWSVNDGPEYCKCCMRTADTFTGRHAIYEMWEAPPLEHYADRITRALGRER